MTNLNEEAGSGVQYEHWVGTIAADNVDLRPIETILGFEENGAIILQIDVYISGGEVSVKAWSAIENEWADIRSAAEEGRDILVRKVFEQEFETVDHNDTNPPRPILGTISGLDELLIDGFKRLHMRLRQRLVGIDRSYVLIEIE